MKVDVSVCWGILIYVGAGADRGIGSEVDSDVGDRPGAVIELEVACEFYSGCVSSWRLDWLFIWHNFW